MNNILNNVYNDIRNPAGFAGINKLYNEARKADPSVTRKDVISFLNGNRTYTLHKLTRKNFLRNKVIAPKPNVILSCDLADLNHLSKHNSGIRYILICIDVFSRYMFGIPMIDKTAKSSLNALKSILDVNMGYSRLYTDLGTEFYNKLVNSYLKSRNIKLYSVSSREIKSCLAERAIKTVKQKIYKYLTSMNTLRYIDVLPQIIETYNNTPHTALGHNQTPANVHKMRNIKQIISQFEKMYKNRRAMRKRVSCNLSVGDIVRLQKLSRTQYMFTKAYRNLNTEELFRIIKIDTTKTVPVFTIQDLSGETIEGIFYRDELIKSALPDYYNVDILKSKFEKGRKRYYVNWRGYPQCFNSWINADDIVSI